MAISLFLQGPPHVARIALYIRHTVPPSQKRNWDMEGWEWQCLNIFGTSSHRKHGTYYGIALCMLNVDRGTMRHLTLIINMSIYYTTLPYHPTDFKVALIGIAFLEAVVNLEVGRTRPFGLTCNRCEMHPDLPHSACKSPNSGWALQIARPKVQDVFVTICHSWISQLTPYPAALHLAVHKSGFAQTSWLSWLLRWLLSSY